MAERSRKKQKEIAAEIRNREQKYKWKAELQK